MTGNMKLERRSNKEIDVDAIVIGDNQLIGPIDKNSNYIPPFLKIQIFLEMLSKTDDSFTWLENKVKKDNAEFEIGEDGIIRSGQEHTDEYMLKMKPIHDCEEFIEQNSFNFWDLIDLISTAQQNAISKKAQESAYRRLANDPKQKALAEIKVAYESDKTQFKRRGFSAQFIREMHSKYPIIESQKTIENLVSALNKENEYIPR